MATHFKEGDRVQVVDREANADDQKSGLFYNYFRGLTGTVQKIYATQEAAVDVDLDSLIEPIVHRHTDVQEQMKTRWLDGLSEEARNRLNEKEKDFRLRYTVLVAMQDLTAPGLPTPAAHAAAASTGWRPDQAASIQVTPISTAHAASASSPASVPKPPVAEESDRRRASSTDLDAAEEAELQRRLSQERDRDIR